MGTFNFQSILHDDAKTWVDAGTLKVKYLVYVVHFIGILKSDPSIIELFFALRSILKERAFE